MKCQYLFDSVPGQDGAICNGYLFRFGSKGDCTVFSMENHQEICEFTLDRIDLLMPHSNSVCFGVEYYQEGDEFPLLYCNIYNTYAREEDRLEGVCCVYRLLRNDKQFTTKLVQLIRIGFVNDLSLWKSLDEKGDVRPYGNFIIDTDKNQYCAFTMRDKDKTTRFFTFNMPKLCDGIYDEKYGVKVVYLQKEDILTWFDCEYSKYIQGACYYKGKIYSLEGFIKNSNKPPKLQVIDLVQQSSTSYDLCSIGLEAEPEFIEAYQDNIYYSDGTGKIYLFEF